MSKSPVASPEQLRLLREHDDRMQGNAAEPGPSQYSAPGQSQDQRVNIEQEDPQSQQQRRTTQQKVVLAQAAARMAQDAASMAGQAAEMARQAADMAARAADQPWDGLLPPPVQQVFHTFLKPGPSNFTPIPPQPPRQIDQPMENYQSQFPAAEAPKRKRKSRASAQEASGSSNRPMAAIAPSPVYRPENSAPLGNDDYQLRLEQQNNKRLLTKSQTRQKQSGEGSGTSGAPAVNFNFTPVPGAVLVPNQRPYGLSDYQYQLVLLEQQNKRLQEEKDRLQQQMGEDKGSGGA
jgi:hypothetical protein